MICCRTAEDQLDAVAIANGIEDAEGTVVSVTSNGQHTHRGATDPHTRFIVWFRAVNITHVRAIDRAIERRGG